MCNTYSVIAQGQNANRHIALCEHGTAHLAWDFATFHLDSDSLLAEAEHQPAHPAPRPDRWSPGWPPVGYNMCES
jgi:hypothetical protein